MSNGGGALLAALDIGTNSFHMVVARVRGTSFEVVTREKELVRLGHGGGDMKELSAEAIERGISALQRLGRLADSHHATVRAVATSAVREAENADVFLRRAVTEAGIDIEVISGLEEARLIHLGVLQALPLFDERLLLVDIGGGSTEVLVGQRDDTITARSFKLGAVRLTDRFFPGGTLTAKSVDACRDYVRSTLATFQREVRTAGFDAAAVSSGTGEAVARMVNAQRGDLEPRTFNCFEFTRAEVDSVVAALVRKRTASSRSKLPGLEAARSDIAVAGAIVLQAVAHTFGVRSFMFSDGALREGVLLDSIARSQGGGLHHLRNVSRRSVRALAQRCDDDLTHSAHVAALALQLFDGIADLHGLGPDAREYLEAGALLANVGLVIAHSKHHLHSYYVIRNSELTGLTDAEIEIIALVARYHRKSAPKASHQNFTRLPADDQHLVRMLAGILRVAIGLDRAHDGRVAEVRVHRRGRRLVIEARPAHPAAGPLPTADLLDSDLPDLDLPDLDLPDLDLPDLDLPDLDLEVYTANERTGLLAEVLATRVEVVAIAHPSLRAAASRSRTVHRLTTDSPVSS